jgi:hemerythrin-like domain-containing protein
MIEHRLIEKMIRAMKRELQRIQARKKVNPVLVDTVVDFVRMYADRCHHGKEEDILFRDLEKKPLSAEHKRVMEELIQEHRWAREITRSLVEANRSYVGGDEKALSRIVECMKTLVEFYPKHIEKEDRHFFLPVMEYLDEQEKDAMLREGNEFDRKLIHEKYQNVVAKTLELTEE